MITRVTTHADARCAACGAGAEHQPTGRALGQGAHALHCACGVVTVYDVGCSLELHQALKANLDRFLAATDRHKVTDGVLWAACRECGSTLMVRVNVCSCCHGAHASGVCEDALARASVGGEG